MINHENLKTLVERLERLEEEKKGIQEDIKEVFSEAKHLGFDAKIIKEIIKIRKQDQADLEEKEILIELYKKALGMISE